MNLNLKGKKALITGGSHGIGLAIKKELEAEGVEVISISRREGYDVMNSKDDGKIGQLAFDADILINNVGGMGTSKFEDFPDCIRKNLVTTIGFTEAFLMNKNKKWGCVITISSIYGKEKGRHDTSPWFVAAKSAQIAYMKTMAGRSENLNIRFNTICPGVIDVGKDYTDLPEAVGKPEDVAGIVAFLCSDRASHINGTTITVDGGESHVF